MSADRPGATTISKAPPAAVLIEADGGSRGNPGPAAYGAVLKDAVSGAVLAEDASTIGTASNNVAEYRGLIAGLRLAADVAPGAAIEVRMDSKLVVEQMSGRWRIKHPAMKPLAAEAGALAPAGTVYTWIPRAQNAHADRLANEALDGIRSGVSIPAADQPDDPAEGAAGAADAPADRVERGSRSARGWSGGTATPTTLLLVRHGVTPMTAEKRFSGGLGGSNPGLTDEGRAQVRATADWLGPVADRVSAVIASPVRRTRESAEIVAQSLGHAVVEEPGFAEMEFGAWDGLTFAEVAERHGDAMDSWLGSLDVAAGGGESLRQVEQRVLGALERVLLEHAGGTVVVVSHVTPIKVLVNHVLAAPLDTVYRMELSPASVTVLSYFAAEERRRASLRLFNARPPGDDAFSAAVVW